MIGASDRALTMARAIGREKRSSPSVKMTFARSASPARAITSAADGPSPPIRMSSGPSSRNEKPRAAVSSCIDDTPMSITTPSTVAAPCAARNLGEMGETIFDQREPAAGSRDEAGACGNRGAVAIDSDHAGIGGVEDSFCVAARAEGRVEVDAAVAGSEPADDGIKQDGRVRCTR